MNCSIIQRLLISCIPLAMYCATAFSQTFPQPIAAVPAVATQSSSGTRTADQVSRDLIQVSDQIRSEGGGPQDLSDAVKRSELAPKLIPLVNRQNALLDEYTVAAGNALPASVLDQMKQHNVAMLYLLGDPGTIKRVDTTAQDSTTDAALEASSTRLLSQWLAAGKDEDAQTKLIDEIEALDVAHPDNVQLATFTFMLSRDAASDELADRLMSISASKMQNAVSPSLKTRMLMIQNARAARKLLASVQGSQIVVSGKTPDGKNFSTADWKGKVVLVNFWAAWCDPCKVELPQIKSIYAKYHDQGLELVGVSNDFSQQDLTGFTASNGMPWPELFDATAAARQQWNPTTTGFGIRAIPTLFLIDKKGVCRAVDARDSMNALIPELLAEKP